MAADPSNVYADETRARAYSELGIAGTYYLAFRDLPEIISAHVKGARALDFGCGAGRSTRFVRDLGFDIVGVDISERMLAAARAADPDGDYRLIPDAELPEFEDGSFDLVTAIYPFDTIPGHRKAATCRELGRVLAADGRLLILVARPEAYVNEWLSFSTRDFAENRSARNGDTVRVVVLDMPDPRPVEDIYCTDEGYREVFAAAGLRLMETHHPLGRSSEPYDWVTETEIAPWAVYVLRR